MKGKDLSKILKLGIIVMVCSICGCCTGLHSIKEKRVYTEDKELYVEITPLTIHMPLGYFALVKIEGEKGVAAIRFLEKYRHRFGDILYRSEYGKEYDGYRFDFSYIKYECYYRDDDGVDFITGKVYYKKDKATLRTIAIIGRLIIGFFDDDRIKCKNIIVETFGANVFRLRSQLGYENKNVVVAPTKWNTLQDIRIDDPRIKWYKYTEEKFQPCPEYEEYKEEPEGLSYYVYKVPVDKLW